MSDWQPGRQGTGYFKKLLAIGRWWDCWLLKYPPGTEIPWHVDPFEGKRHYRLNLVLWGEQTFEGRTAILRLGPLVVFRPDIVHHRVSRVSRERMVLSIGWVLDNRPEGE